MAQKSHVPKFGNWDGDEGDNVPYTAYFENARKEKIGGGRMNPNDPEENPDAFMFSGSGFINGGSDYSNNSAAPLQTASGKKQTKSTINTTSSEYSHDHNHNNNNNNNNAKLNLHQRKRSESKKSISDLNSHSFFPLSPSRPRGAGANNNNGSDDISYRSISVPKFGAWDEKDPKSAEGFTVIFNKVKEEKQIAASKFPPLPSQTPNTPQHNHKRASSSKMRCCFF